MASASTGYTKQTTVPYALIKCGVAVVLVLLMCQYRKHLRKMGVILDGKGVSTAQELWDASEATGSLVGRAANGASVVSIGDSHSSASCTGTGTSTSTGTSTGTGTGTGTSNTTSTSSSSSGPDNAEAAERRLRCNHLAADTKAFRFDNCVGKQAYDTYVKRVLSCCLLSIAILGGAYS